MLSAGPPISDRWGGVFYHPVFVDAASECTGLRGYSSNIYIDGLETGAINLLFQDRRSIRAATIPLLFQYFGPLVSRSDDKGEYLRNLDKHLSEQADFVYFSFTPDFDLGGSFPDGWKFRKSATLAVSREKLLNWGNDFKDDVKNKIRKAGREKVTVEALNYLPADLWSMTFTHRKMKPPLEPSALGKWCATLINHSLLKIYAARAGDNLAAFRGQLVFGDYAYDWIAGSDPQYRSTGANQLLMAEIGNEHQRAGIGVWDLIDGGIKSIADFKRSFGAEEQYHYLGSKSYSLKGRLFGITRNIKNVW